MKEIYIDFQLLDTNYLIRNEIIEKEFIKRKIVV